MIEAPGVYQMPAEEYHADPCVVPSLSSSTAKVLLTHSPRHAWTGSRRLNPNYVNKESATFDRGSAAHALLLEGEDRMAVIPFADYRKDAAQKMRDDARLLGRFPILEAEYPTILKMRNVMLQAIAENIDFGGMTLADGMPEQTIIWREGEAYCRARLDWVSRDRRVIFDYKSTAASAHPDAWVKTMLGLGGEVQESFYRRGNAATGGPEDGGVFVFGVQEVVEPFAVSFIALPPPFQELGRSKVFTAIELWQRCLSSGQWPAYPARVCYVDAPAWAVTQWENRAIGADPTPMDNDEHAPIDAETLRIGARAGRIAA